MSRSLITVCFIDSYWLFYVVLTVTLWRPWAWDVSEDHLSPYSMIRRPILAHAEQQSLKVSTPTSYPAAATPQPATWKCVIGPLKYLPLMTFNINLPMRSTFNCNTQRSMINTWQWNPMPSRYPMPQHPTWRLPWRGKRYLKNVSTCSNSSNCPLFVFVLLASFQLNSAGDLQFCRAEEIGSPKRVREPRWLRSRLPTCWDPGVLQTWIWLDFFRQNVWKLLSSHSSELNQCPPCQCLPVAQVANMEVENDGFYHHVPFKHFIPSPISMLGWVVRLGQRIQFVTLGGWG